MSELKDLPYPTPRGMRILTVKKPRICYSNTDFDHRGCLCLENSMHACMGYVCTIGFKQIKGIPQEPCYKPTTYIEKRTATEWWNEYFKTHYETKAGVTHEAKV
jgi:hypothetical protein